MIINCKCKKYAFSIPDDSISSEGRIVQCGFCDEQWFHKNENNNDEISSSTLNLEIPIPHKNLKEVKESTSKDKSSNFYSIVFTSLLFISALFAGIHFNEDLILLHYPFLSGFFEASEIVKDIIMQSINWATEFAQSLFK